METELSNTKKKPSVCTVFDAALMRRLCMLKLASAGHTERGVRSCCRAVGQLFIVALVGSSRGNATMPAPTG